MFQVVVCFFVWFPFFGTEVQSSTLMDASHVLLLLLAVPRAKKNQRISYLVATGSFITAQRTIPPAKQQPEPQQPEPSTGLIIQQVDH